MLHDLRNWRPTQVSNFYILHCNKIRKFTMVMKSRVREMRQPYLCPPQLTCLSKLLPTSLQSLFFDMSNSRFSTKKWEPEIPPPEKTTDESGKCQLRASRLPKDTFVIRRENCKNWAWNKHQGNPKIEHIAADSLEIRGQKNLKNYQLQLSMFTD